MATSDDDGVEEQEQPEARREAAGAGEAREEAAVDEELEDGVGVGGEGERREQRPKHERGAVDQHRRARAPLFRVGAKVGSEDKG